MKEDSLSPDCSPGEQLAEELMEQEAVNDMLENKSLAIADLIDWSERAAVALKDLDTERSRVLLYEWPAKVNAVRKINKI